jgi:hypothetical protein
MPLPEPSGPPDARAERMPSSASALGDLVGFGDLVGLDGAQPPAQALAGLPQQPERDGGRPLRGGPLRISPVFLDEMGLQGRGYFIRRLQRLVDG